MSSLDPVLVTDLLGVASPGRHGAATITAAERAVESLHVLIGAEGNAWDAGTIRLAFGLLDTVLAEAGAYDLETKADPPTEVTAELAAMRGIRQQAAEALLALLRREPFAELHPFIEAEVAPIIRGVVDRYLPFRVLKVQAIAERLHTLRARTPDPATRELLAGLYSTKYPRFGTSGFRARYPDDFSDQRLAAVVAAICDHVERAGLAGHPVVISYDSRLRADHMARLAAGVCLARGLKVHLMSRDTPSPSLIHYATHVLGADANAGLINCTPSHNPVRSVETGRPDDREWHGIRYNQPTGCVAPTDVTDAIGAGANRYLLREAALPVMPVEKAGERLTWVDDALEHYTDWVLAKLEHALSLPDGSAVTGAELVARHFGGSQPRIVVDEMHSASRGYLRRVLDRLGVPHEVLHGDRDPTLGELAYANPEREHLHLCAQRVVQHSAPGAPAIGLGVDTDSDRFGVVDATGEFVTPNQVIVLLGRYLMEARYRDRQGIVVRTVSTTRMLDRVAAAAGDRVVPPADAIPPHARHPFYRAVVGELDTLRAPIAHVVAVGFKYLAGAMIAAGRRLPAAGVGGTRRSPLADELRQATAAAFTAGEESGGLTTMDHTLDKDGLWANLLMLEMCAYYGRTPLELWADVEAAHGAVWTQRFDAMAPDVVKEELVDSYLREYETNPSAPLIGGFEVVFVGGVSGDMVEIVLAETGGKRRAHLLIRSSGTEPMVRIYVEAREEQTGQALLAAARDRLGRMTAEAIAGASSDWELAQLLTETAVLRPPHLADEPLVPPEMAAAVLARLRALYPDEEATVEGFVGKLSTLAPAVATDFGRIAS